MSPKSEPVMVPGRRVCPIADALDVVGDRWTLLVVRELSFGVHRFNDIQRHTGAPRQMIALRLRKLEEAGLIAANPYSAHPPRVEYTLTPCGQSLIPVLDALRAWGEEYREAGTLKASPEQV